MAAATHLLSDCYHSMHVEAMASECWLLFYHMSSQRVDITEHLWTCNQGLSPVFMQTSSISRKASLTCFLLPRSPLLILLLMPLPIPHCLPLSHCSIHFIPVSQDLCRCHLCRSVLPETSAHGVNTDQQEVRGWDKGIRERGYQYVNWEWASCSVSHCSALT